MANDFTVVSELLFTHLSGETMMLLCTVVKIEEIIINAEHQACVWPL